MTKHDNITSRILADIGRARTLGQLVRIGSSTKAQGLRGQDAEAVAAAVSDRLVNGIDYDLPIPRGGA